MKKVLRFMIISYLVALLLSSCTLSSNNGNVSPVDTVVSENTISEQAAANAENRNPAITVESPMTLSNNICTFNGRTVYLRLKMIKGRYYEDWSPGTNMGTLWEGSFVIGLADEYGRTIAETDISKTYTGPLVFKSSSFNIEFVDYNNDGDPDFTIGQYASSNGRVYKIFTLRKNGKVEELPVKYHSGLFISNSTGYYSTRLNKIDAITFQTEYYNNAEGTYRDCYRWDDGYGAFPPLIVSLLRAFAATFPSCT